MGYSSLPDFKASLFGRLLIRIARIARLLGVIEDDEKEDRDQAHKGNDRRS
jgi:hypothetical protein